VDHRYLISASFLALALLATSCEPASKSNSVSGTIETDEVHVASRYGGRVDQTLVREGDNLKAGQVVVELDAARRVQSRPAPAGN
jgi:HlyD family secretion protein